MALVEPTLTARLRLFLDDVRNRLDDQQRNAIEIWEQTRPLDSSVLAHLRVSLDPQQLERMGRRLVERAGGVFQPIVGANDIATVVMDGRERPAVASTMLWRSLAPAHHALASHLIQIVRERAALPPLRRVIETAELAHVGPAIVTWFADRQLEDACVWMENIPPPVAGTLIETKTVIEARRAHALQVPVDSLVPFVRRAASFLLQLSTRAVDPVGLALGSDAQLDTNPTIERRMEIARWARSAGHTICVRGQMLALTIPLRSTAPHTLQLIAAEPGHGACGGVAFLLRLLAVEVPQLSAAPTMLCLPDEEIEERGARFERWLSVAYPQATQAWRMWC